MRIWFLSLVIGFGMVSSGFAQSVELTPIKVLGETEIDQDFNVGLSFPEYLSGENSGVDIQSRMSNGLLQDVSIRAGIFEDANVSLNGASLNNPQTGHFNLSLPVVSTDIQGLDLNLNGQSLNFKLIEPSQEGGYLRAASGNGGFAESTVSYTAKSGNAYHRFSAEGMRTDGLRDDTDGYRTAGSYMFSQKNVDRDVMVYASMLVIILWIK